MNIVKKIRVNRLTKSINEYLRYNYYEEPLDDISSKCKPRIQYSISDRDPIVNADNKKTDSNVKYSSRENYNSITISQILRGFSSDLPQSEISGRSKSLDKYTDMSFVDKMLEHIDKKNLKDSDVYKAAFVDRRLYSKIVSDKNYKPAKDTCISLALALHLTYPEAKDLLSRAGYVLSHSNKRDVIVEYFFKQKIYDILKINDVLYSLDQKILGRV